jgi:hypothetical protein
VSFVPFVVRIGLRLGCVVRASGANCALVAVFPGSWKLSKRLFDRFLIDRMIQDADMVLSTFFNPNLRGAHELNRFQLGQNVIAIRNDLHIKPVPRFGQPQGYTLLVVGHDCRGGNLPLTRPDFKRFLAVEAAKKKERPSTLYLRRPRLCAGVSYLPGFGCGCAMACCFVASSSAVIACSAEESHQR